MRGIRRVGAFAATLGVAACHRGKADGGSAPLDQRPFAAYATQRLIVTPTAHARAGDTLGWVQGMGGPRGAARAVDGSIQAALDARGLASRWVLPSELTRTFERNRTYAADPYLLSVEPLRSASFTSGSRIGEPLATQLRTMIAFEADARLVLLPIELRFEREGAGMRGVLRLALIDPRAAEARWVGEVKGGAATSAAVSLASVGQRVADLFVAP